MKYIKPQWSMGVVTGVVRGEARVEVTDRFGASLNQGYVIITPGNHRAFTSNHLGLSFGPAVVTIHGDVDIGKKIIFELRDDGSGRVYAWGSLDHYKEILDIYDENHSPRVQGRLRHDAVVVPVRPTVHVPEYQGRGHRAKPGAKQSRQKHSGQVAEVPHQNSPVQTTTDEKQPQILLDLDRACEQSEWRPAVAKQSTTVVHDDDGQIARFNRRYRRGGMPCSVTVP